MLILASSEARAVDFDACGCVLYELGAFSYLRWPFPFPAAPQAVKTCFHFVFEAAASAMGLIYQHSFCPGSSPGVVSHVDSELTRRCS